MQAIERLEKSIPTGGFYARIRILSIDVALGALGAGWMVALYLGVAMRWVWFVILPLAVWAIYTGDHLMDAHNLGDKSSTARHQFHHRYFKVLMVLAILAALTSVVLALLYMRLMGIWFGLGMGGLVIIHLSLVKFVGERSSPFLAKELGVAIIYTAGIWGLPLLLSGKLGTREAVVPAVQFMLLALVNLLEFSLYEYESDLADGQTSFVQAIGRKRAIRFIRLILALIAGLGAFLLATVDGKPLLRLEFIFTIMGLALAALIYKPVWFMQSERYRVVGDAAFLIPFLYPLMGLI